MKQTQKMELVSVKLGPNSPLNGKTVADSHLTDKYYSMLVKIQRPDGEYIQPEANTTMEAGDVVWLVGDPQIIDKLRGK